MRLRPLAAPDHLEATGHPGPYCKAAEPRWSRRNLLTLAGAAALSPLAAPAHASSDTVRLVVGFPPGGSTDVIARLISPGLAAALGKTVIVENKPGASGTLAIRQVEASAPNQDVYALYPTTTMMGFVVNGQEAELDKISAISMVYEQYGFVVVNPQYPDMAEVRTLNDLFALAKTKMVNYCSSGPGTGGHLSMERLARQRGLQMEHVAYKGAMAAVNDILGNHIGVILMDPTNIGAHLKSGRLRALSVSYEKRSADFPDVPTSAESGYPELQTAVSWVNFIGPAKMPADKRRRMGEVIQKLVADPEINRRLIELYAVPRTRSPEDTARIMARDLKHWKQVIAEGKKT
ncbi:tripartite tricarboxylate transporter substrate binding protein [Comamonas serinivorans]|nr:tripartite tricarboxylate transporter substrate binding protein [Comamonas serinivorans]